VSVPLFGSQTINGVTFSCGRQPQTNLAGVTVADDVNVSVTNGSGERIVMRYRVILMSIQGRKFDSGPLGKQLGSGAVDPHQYSPSGKASTQDEFADTCQFIDVQVCPTKIPATWPKTPGSAYYDPFRNGPVDGCRKPQSLTPEKLPAHVKLGCTALVIGYSHGTNWWTKYGEFIRPFYTHTATTKEEAVAASIAQASARGLIVYNDENHQPSQVQCDATHGAVTALRKAMADEQ